MQGDRDQRLGEGLLPRDCACPDYIDRGLKQVDPSAVLLYIGHGRWWLGILKAPAEDRGLGYRQADGRKALALEYHKKEPNYWRVARAKLKMRGFQYVAQFSGPPSWRIVLDFQERDYNYRTQLLQIEAQMARESDGTAAAERMQKGAEDAGRYLARQAYRAKVHKPHSVSAASH